MKSYSKSAFCKESDDGDMFPKLEILVMLGQLVANIVKDPRNISPDEWQLVEPVYSALDQYQWDEVIAVAKVNSDFVKRSIGPGENSRSSKRLQSEIHKVLNVGG